MLALASAATFGFNNAALRRGVITGGVLHAMAITVPLGVPLFLLASLPFGGIDSIARLAIDGGIWLALAGIVHFAVGRYGNYRAIKALGSTLSSPMQQLSIPISLALALLYLEEVLTPLRAAGLMLVMAGPLIALPVRRTKERLSSGNAFKPRYPEGLFWGAVGAIGYGCSPLLIVLGLGPDSGLAESLAGGFISYLAAALVILALVLAAGGSGYMKTLDRGNGKWFLIAGVLVFLSQMFRYMALSIAPVSVVVPLQRLSVIFRIIFSWLLNPEHEVISARVIIGIGLSILGAIALSLGSEVTLTAILAKWPLR